MINTNASVDQAWGATEPQCIGETMDHLHQEGLLIQDSLSQLTPVKKIFVESLGKVSMTLSDCTWEGKLEVVEATSCSWDCHVHISQFTD